MSDRGPFLLPWVSIRPNQEQDTDAWWDCECTAYDFEPTLRDAVFAANAHGRACRKGEFRWNLYAPRTVEWEELTTAQRVHVTALRKLRQLLAEEQEATDQARTQEVKDV